MRQARVFAVLVLALLAWPAVGTARERDRGQASRAGANTVAFSGRVGRTALPAGSYRAVLVATDAARNASKSATASFKVIKKWAAGP